MNKDKSNYLVGFIIPELKKTSMCRKTIQGRQHMLFFTQTNLMQLKIIIDEPQ